MTMNIVRESVDESKYIIATYEIKAPREMMMDVARAIAIGQSIGNPNARSVWETDQMIEDHAAKILKAEDWNKPWADTLGEIKIAFPVANINIKTDGISQLMCQLMGGQMDIDFIHACRLVDIKFPQSILEEFKGPKYGTVGIREFTGAWGRPLFGGIVKPKVGLTPEGLLTVVKEMVEGGVDFIKEDEILSNPAHCPLEVRVPLIMNYLKSINSKVIYAVCVNSDPPYLLDRVRRVHKLGGNAVHVNFWSGLGAYKAIRDMDLPLFLFFQKSGDKVITTGKYSIAWPVICDLAGRMGVDFIHAGMIDGYMDTDEKEMDEVLGVLEYHDVMPSLSCGMTPDKISPIVEKIGRNWMASSGGYIHSHEGGTRAGCEAMREAVENES